MHNGNSLLALVKWNIFYFEGEGIFFSRYNALSQISDAEQGSEGCKLTRCKDKSRTPFDSFISLPLFLSSYLKIFKDLLFVPLGEGEGTFCPSALWFVGHYPYHHRSILALPFFFLFRSRKKRERRPVRGEVRFSAEARRRFRVIHYGSPSKNHPFFSHLPSFLQIVHLSFLFSLLFVYDQLEYIIIIWHPCKRIGNQEFLLEKCCASLETTLRPFCLLINLKY